MAELLVVGIGPGSYEMMTAEAEKALACCSVIAGYTVYVDLIKGWLGEKEYLVTPMRRERERCAMALASAAGEKIRRWCAAATAGCTAWLG